MTTETLRKSDITIHEYDADVHLSRETVTVTIPVGGLKIGSVLTTAGTLVTVATTANAAYVVDDTMAYTYAEGATVKVNCLARLGVVAKANLVYGSDIDTQGEKDAVLAVLLTKFIKAI